LGNFEALLTSALGIPNGNPHKDIKYWDLSAKEEFN
jgi:hypothetical protein